MSKSITAELVQKDLDALYLGNLNTVEFDLELPEAGENGSEFTWHSDNLAFLSHDGKVSRPAYGRGNREATLTVCARLDDCEAVREFSVTILENNNKIEVEEIYPISLQAQPEEVFYLPQASAVRTADQRVIAHLIDWDGGMACRFDKEGEYQVTGRLKDTGIKVVGTVCVSRQEFSHETPETLAGDTLFSDRSADGEASPAARKGGLDEQNVRNQQNIQNIAGSVTLLFSAHEAQIRERI